MKKITAALIVGILFISCSQDADDQPLPKLSGEWYLTQAECYCAFDPNIDFNDFTLQFDPYSNVVTVNNPVEDYYYFAESGSYQYTLQEDKIFLINSEPFIYNLNGSTLTLTKIDDPSIADDELVLIYQRAE